MHRLQISLPRWQVQFLTERARRDESSIAEVIRRMVQREAQAAPTQANVDSLLEMAGIAEDHGPLIEGVPVSERPDLYLAALAVTQATPRKASKRQSTARRPRAGKRAAR